MSNSGNMVDMIKAGYGLAVGHVVPVANARAIGCIVIKLGEIIVNKAMRKKTA